MIYEGHRLVDFYPGIADHETHITSYVISPSLEMGYPKKKPAILIIPGGGYAYASIREAEPIAIAFLAKGFSCFVLDAYPCKPKEKYRPLIDAYLALNFLQKRADYYDIDPSKIAVMGFSAGGHLAATLSAYYDEKFLEEITKQKLLYPPYAAVLGYPVISTGAASHTGTKTNLLDNQPELADFYSIEKHVKPSFPKTYVFTTAKDTVVPVKNSELLAEALKKARVKCQYHLFPDGYHGFSLAAPWVYSKEAWESGASCCKEAAIWVDEACAFLNE